MARGERKGGRQGRGEAGSDSKVIWVAAYSTAAPATEAAGKKHSLGNCIEAARPSPRGQRPPKRRPRIHLRTKWRERNQWFLFVAAVGLPMTANLFAVDVSGVSFFRRLV